jgi:hypothetical protein
MDDQRILIASTRFLQEALFSTGFLDRFRSLGR